MRTNRKAVEQQQRARWMADFETHVVRVIPWHAGRICWDTAAFHYNQGTRADVAADAYSKRVCAEHKRD